MLFYGGLLYLICTTCLIMISIDVIHFGFITINYAYDYDGLFGLWAVVWFVCCVVFALDLLFVLG